MRASRLILALAAVISISATPVLAAKSGPNTGTRGLVSVTISNYKGHPDRCLVKTAVKNISPDTAVYLVSNKYRYTAEAASLGYVDGDGVFTATYAPDPNTVARSDYNNTWMMTIVEDDYYPVMSIDGVTPAVWNITNNCSPAA